MSSQSPQHDQLAGFGPNQWLVDELYQRYLDDKNSVDPAWWDFFEDYVPGEDGEQPPTGRPATTQAQAPAASATAAAPAAAKAPAPARPAATAGKAAAANAAPAEATPAPAKAPTAPAKAAPKAKAPAPTGKAEPDAENATAATAATAEPEVSVLRGAPARVVTNMEASLQVPTATSVRSIPAKLLIENRTDINAHLARSRGGKVSFTHLIGYAVVRAAQLMPEMNHSYTQVDGKPAVVQPAHVNLGLAIDLPKPDGTRQLLVPAIKNADTLDFAQFMAAYEDVVRRARNNKLTVEDFSGVTISLTNPGTLGTVHSVPRLMQGQGTIVGVGALEYPAEFQGASAEAIARNAVSKTITLTSTYDHRIIQGAQSGDFLRHVHRLLLGEDRFYDDVFRSLAIPYTPYRWVPDIAASHEDDVNKTARVQQLIHAYRVRGHLLADTDPIEYRVRRHVDLALKTHDLTVWDLDREFAVGGFGGRQVAKLRDVLDVLRDSYCRTIGVEYMHIQDPEQRAWVQDRIERSHAKPDRDEQLRILRKLNAAEAFENFIQTKYVGQKRFSLEGGESLIPLLDAILSAAAKASLDEVAIGMAHRGRLNVLANIAGKSYAKIFREFEGDFDDNSVQGSGDVKYHLGTEGTFTNEDGDQCRVYLAANPSHLEAVNPVLQGIVRAKQDELDHGEAGFTVLPILVHGDAAFAGQGVVAETLNLSQLRGYRTGGTVHVVVNNQVGFTTSPEESRSSVYATDVARMIQAPIFHVNGDDPEACVRVARLAFEFRQAFKKDVVIDMVCYRRRGHNEIDDPSLTQPLMYNRIDGKRSVRKLYTEALVGRGDINVEEAEQALRDYQQQLERVHTETREAGPPKRKREPQNVPAVVDVDVRTTIDEETIKHVVESQINLPEDFTPHPRLAPQLQRRAQMVEDDTIDWAMGEALAFGALLAEGRKVRLAGQDSRRGTFGQRHAVIVDRVTGHNYKPLKALYQGNAKLWVYDSLLSEYAAMGFEYGYSVANPDALVLWEAQFGDFANGAQIIIDEFIASGQQKWGEMSRVTLLLPHGYEGQGPDHSSGRIERFLSLCAQDNMTVAVPSTPASYFHLLRRQGLGATQRPLVVFTPKSMLRLKAAASAKADFTHGSWQPVLPDTTTDPSSVRRVLLCSGKVYYDLLAARKARGADDVAIVRLEQLYPLPVEGIRAALEPFPSSAELMWVQEEPRNQGAWGFLAVELAEHLDRPLLRASRPPSSAPAVGTQQVHEVEQKALVEAALA